MALFETRVTFTVPVTATNYAPERIQLNSQSAPAAWPTPSLMSPPMLGITVMIEALPATATLELWLLKAGADPTADANYFFHDSTAVGKTYALAGYRGAQFRAKSGGTAGNLIATAVAD